MKHVRVIDPQAIDHRQGSCRTLEFRKRDGTIQFNDRAVSHLEQLIVQAETAPPVGVGRRRASLCTPWIAACS